MRTTAPHYGRAVLTGLVGSVVATYAKTLAEAQLQPLAEKALPPTPAQREEIGADPAGHPANMPPAELADQVAQATLHTELGDERREQASNVLHWVMGVGFGTAYAVAGERLPAVRAGRGTLAGLALFGAAHVTALPAAGVQHSPANLPRAWWIWEGGSHVVYGGVLDAAVRLARAGVDRVRG